MFYKTIKNLKSSNNAINFYVIDNFKKIVLIHSKKKGYFKNEFFEHSDEIVFRSFSELIRIIGKNYYSSRGKKLEKVLVEIQKKK